MTQSQTQTQERRGRERAPCFVPAFVRKQSGTGFYGMATDVSAGGVCVRGHMPLERGTPVYLELVLPGEGEPWTAEGTVVWNSRGGGHEYTMGFCLSAATEKERENLERFSEFKRRMGYN